MANVRQLSLLTICAAVLTLMLGLLQGPLSSSDALAQNYNGYSNNYGYSQRWRYRKNRYRSPRRARTERRAKRRTAKKRRIKREKEQKYSGRKIEGPVTAVISLKKQRMVIYDGKGVVASTRVSTGKNGHRTPTGVFSVIQKRARHFSNLYGGAPMPFMQRITWSGIALHAGVVPSYPASHGCIRLPYNFARKFWRMTKMGTRVVITRNGATPRPISHAKLIKPLPPGTPLVVPQPNASGETPADAASNSKDQASKVVEFIGVQSANAATDSGDLRTRATVAAARNDEVLRRKDMLAGAKDAHEQASIALKEANLTIRATTKEIAKVKADRRRLIVDEKKAKKQFTKTVGKLKRFFKKFRNAKSEKAVERGIEKEDALEAELMQYERDAAEAKRNAGFAADLIEKKKALLADQVSQRKKLKIAFNAMSKSVLAAKKSLKDAKRTVKEQNYPIHIMVSRKSQKLYVRQGHRDIMEHDISVDFPDAPIGTHVFTAVKYINDESDLSWSTVTAARKSLKTSKKKKKKKKRDEESLFAKGPAQTPANALERIDIPQELRDKLAEYIKPGSSLIISDEKKSHETGLGTDIIVLTRS